MKARSLIILLIIAVVVGLICFALARKSAEEVKASVGGKPYESVPINDSEKIVVRDAKGECVIEKSNGVWVVPSKGGYQADFSKISSLLREIVELKPTQKILGGEACLERFDLLPPGKDTARSGLEIQVFGKDSKPLLSLRKGKPYKQTEGEEDQMAMMMGGGAGDSARFVFIPERNSVVVVSTPLHQASTKDADWIGKDFIKVSEPKSVSLVDGGKTLWTLRRESASAEWGVDGEAPANTEFDKQKVGTLVSSLSWLNFTDVAGKVSAKPEHGFDHPRTLLAESFDGFTYKFNLGDDEADKIYATVSVDFKPVPRIAPKDEKPEDAKKAEDDYNKKLSESKEKASKMSKLVDGWVYVFDKYAFDNLLSGKDKFFKAKAEEKKPEELKTADPLTGFNMKPEDILKNVGGKSELKLEATPASEK